MMLNKYTFLLVLLFTTVNLLTAQSNLSIDDSYTVEEMVQDFFNTSNVVTSNITYTGSQQSVVFFDAEGTDLEIGAGILITTGLATDIAAENQDFLNNASTGLGTQGDNDLETLTGIGTNDAAVIAFDFTVITSDSLNFNYVFGSEEYPEFVCQGFNDAFAFFVSGPGITGSFSNNAINTSTIPGNGAPVTINNINDVTTCGDPSNEIYYVNNMDGQHVNFDGLTVSFPSSFYAIGGETYHAKIAIADAGDGIYDSGIFLSFEGLGSDNLLEPEAEFQFVQNESTFNFDNTTKYARSWDWDFGNTVTSSERNPGTIQYDEIGTYTIQLITENFCCIDTFTTEVEVTELSLQLSVNATVTSISCTGFDDAAIQFSINGGVAPYTTVWEPMIDDLNNIPPGTYNYTITDSNEDEITGTIIINEVIVPDISFTTIDATNGTDGYAAVEISGGTPPYQYLWSNGATTPSIENIAAGEYSVTITDANGCENILTLEVGSITSVYNIIDNSFLHLFPNPVSEILFIENNSERKVLDLKVFDILGQQYPIDYTVQNNRIQVTRLSDFPEGIFTIKLKWSDEKISTLRFVKL